MHDGVYGRSHLYSYVNDNGTWWKTVDWVVTEVSAICLQIERAHELMCSFPIGFRGDRSNRPDRLSLGRRALLAHL